MKVIIQVDRIDDTPVDFELSSEQMVLNFNAYLKSKGVAFTDCHSVHLGNFLEALKLRLISAIQ